MTTRMQLPVIPVVTRQSIHGIRLYNFHDLLLNPHPMARIRGTQGRIVRLHPIVPTDHLQFSQSTCRGLGGPAHRPYHLVRQV
jgi:hypothetical protein